MLIANQFGALAGGIGLFLLGMWLMTDGLRLAAGAALRRAGTLHPNALAGTALRRTVQQALKAAHAVNRAAPATADS